VSTPSEGDGSLLEVKIAEGPSALKVLGYLDLGVHKLQIGHTVIKVLNDDLTFMRMGHHRRA
jgi:hypothetical protein